MLSTLQVASTGYTVPSLELLKKHQ